MLEPGGTELFEEVLGGRTYVSLRFPLTCADGRILGMAGISTDVTARHRAEERFRRAFEAAPIGMALMSLEGRFLRVNPALCAITGYERRRARGDLRRGDHPPRRPRVLAARALGVAPTRRARTSSATSATSPPPGTR